MLNKKLGRVDTLSYKTVSANKATVNKEWVLVDAENLVLGRLASEVAKILRGKHKPEFTPHVDCGDNVIVINAEKVQLTGNKMTDRLHFRHSGYPGGQTKQTPKQILDKYPERLVEKAVKGMLPKNKLGRQLFRNLHVVVGAEHKYEAQKPKVVDLSTNN
ncbi:LSU ribosomal protein L13P [Mariniphaga anaerophila]|uniref:Large ribosomal subunit protein uL13 n=1 Tax=Mariniphaga anaerophila TaxID=1484053 RepID=A0A1M4YJK8_9BACT|nr:LSU ribosomal protein L13P [Mariniphaga anaerophila]